jgi:predicted Zn-dependent peptidase
VSAELRAVGDLSVLEQRPGPGAPREYRFPAFQRQKLVNGMTLIAVDLPGRPLLTAQLILEGGAGAEPTELAGVTALTARALSEGTARRSAVELIEAAERLGSELHAESGWETLVASVEVPRSRFAPALALLAEMVLQPSFPEEEITRLREERLNDLMQAMADPRRRAERAFAGVLYSASSPYSRAIGGTEETVARITRDAVVERHRAVLSPKEATLIVAGALEGLDVAAIAQEQLGDWSAVTTPPSRTRLVDTANESGPRVVLVDRPGATQTQVRVGHVGLPRRIPDFHAVSVMSSILGGLFNSRLQRLLREERGYTYGIGAGFEFRRSAGPFAVRTAVQTDVTIPALQDILGELRRIRAALVDEDELRDARDYLIGVFPLRFESPGQVVAAIAGVVAFGLPDDELDRYRSAIAAVTVEDVQAASRHVRPDELSIVLVADASVVAQQLRDAGLGAPEIVRDPMFLEATAAEAPIADASDLPGPGPDGPEPDGPVPDEPWPDEPAPAGLELPQEEP